MSEDQTRTSDTTASVEVGETRYDHYGPLRAMAIADNYVMCRRPRCAPWVLSVKDWLKLSETDDCVGKSSAPRAMHYGVLA
jgi:hypothetical protein